MCIRTYKIVRRTHQWTRFIQTIQCPKIIENKHIEISKYFSTKFQIFDGNKRKGVMLKCNFLLHKNNKFDIIRKEGYTIVRS